MNSVTPLSYQLFVYAHLDPYIKGKVPIAQLPSTLDSEENSSDSSLVRSPSKRLFDSPEGITVIAVEGDESLIRDLPEDAVIERRDASLLSDGETTESLLAATQRVSTTSFAEEEGISPFLQLFQRTYNPSEDSSYDQLRECYLSYAIEGMHCQHAFKWSCVRGEKPRLVSVLREEEKKQHCHRLATALQEAIAKDFQGAPSHLFGLSKEEILERTSQSLDRLYQKELARFVRSAYREGSRFVNRQYVEKMGFSVSQEEIDRLLEKESEKRELEVPVQSIHLAQKELELAKKDLIQKVVEQALAIPECRLWEEVQREYRARFREFPDRCKVWDQCVITVCNKQGTQSVLTLSKEYPRYVKGVSKDRLQEAMQALEKKVLDVLFTHFPHDQELTEYAAILREKIEGWAESLCREVIEDQSHLFAAQRYRECCIKQEEQGKNLWLDITLKKFQEEILATLKQLQKNPAFWQNEENHIRCLLERDYLLYTAECLHDELSLLPGLERLQERVLERLEAYLSLQSILLSDPLTVEIRQMLDKKTAERVRGLSSCNYPDYILRTTESLYKQVLSSNEAMTDSVEEIVLQRLQEHFTSRQDLFKAIQGPRKTPGILTPSLENRVREWIREQEQSRSLRKRLRES